MPRIDGLARIVAAILIIVCSWWADRRMDQATRWVSRGRKLQAWVKHEPQTRS